MGWDVAPFAEKGERNSEKGVQAIISGIFLLPVDFAGGLPLVGVMDGR